MFFLKIAVEVKLKTSSAPCSLLPAPFQLKDYVLNYTSLAILIRLYTLGFMLYSDLL
ncbi:hypothetical protein [Moorena producens]|uniref:hypothetical protein n=1 Tax=Moorena producens TaxID=1155739 RepID=UPI0013143CB9|nr:hypothetical protein [Moorena producens]